MPLNPEPEGPPVGERKEGIKSALSIQFFASADAINKGTNK